jgi:hypothetical protein
MGLGGWLMGTAKQDKIIDTLPDFNATYRHVPIGGKAAVAIDEKRRKIYMMSGTHSGIIGFDKIVSCEILEAGVSRIRTDRGSQIAGAAVGAALLGPVGLLAGALSGSKTSTPEITTLELRVTVDDLSCPVYSLWFWKTPTPARLELHAYRRLMEQVAEWHGRFEAIIRAQNTMRNRPLTDHSANATSVADELRKLADLRREGILTDEEFAAEKRRLLTAG